MASQNLLVELLVEELPPKALKKLGEAFSSALFESLKTQGLTAENSAVISFATPRRLAAHITQVAAKAGDKQIAQKLMPTSVGLDANGKATPALIKRLQALGVDESAVAKLRKENDGKTDILLLDILVKGISLTLGLQKAIYETFDKLPIPKMMSYQLVDGWDTVNFVRPAHGLVALHGADIVPISLLGIAASNTTNGHRFEAAKPTITIKNADSYAEQLKTEGAVIASFAERRDEIVRQLNTAATKQNLKPIEDDALLDEVTALVERPNVLLGQFEEIYLEVPQECLILTMKANQKYFPLLDANGKLTNKFLIVSNINPADPSAVIGGNERVVRPRLADAKFFFDQDRKKTLESRIAGLDKVVYHNKLGSQGERTSRVQQIAFSIARLINDNETFLSKVYLAAALAKTDLLTDMVGEFPELQGIMGRYYAQHEKLDDDISYAIEDHYKPRFSGDELPRNQVGVCVALADKLETLVGLFGIGEKPTGDKDPFGLRRHALGVIRMLIEKDLPFGVYQLIEFGENTLPNLTAVLDSLSEFIFERLAGALREQGYSSQEVDAVISLRPQRLSDIPKRLEAARTFSTLPEAPALAAANKRVGNILKKAEGEVKAEVKASLLQEPAEIALNAALSKVKPEADKLFESGDYTASLKALAALKAPVDDFFDNVMVNAENIDLRNNRLALLAQLHAAMNRVADLSKLAS
ncbi:MAG: glycine--tRNA ligase subunit beta [Methylotenera sp.]